MKFYFPTYMYAFFVVMLSDKDKPGPRLQKLIDKGVVHRNPYNKGWFFGPTPDYAKATREERQMSQWAAL